MKSEAGLRTAVPPDRFGPHNVRVTCHVILGTIFGSPVKNSDRL